MALVDFQLFQSGHEPPNAADAIAARLEVTRQEGWAQGYEAGRNAASDELDLSRARTEERLSQSLSAMQEDFAAYRREWLNDLKPLLTDLTSYLLPQMAKSVLAPQLVELLCGVLSHWLAEPLIIAAHPDNLGILQRAVAHLPGEGITWLADREFSQSQLELRQGDRMRRLDLGEAARQMVLVLETYFDIDLLEQEYATTNRR